MGLVFRDTKEWRGEWSNIELYYLDNLVRRNGSVYLCLAPHIGQEPPLDGGVYWDLYAEKGDPGTNGTDGTDGSDGVVQAIVAGSNISVDNTDPANPVVSASGSLGLTSVNGESGPAITIALGTTAQTNDLGIVVATNTITLHIPNASATDRGVITAGTQTFGGAKTFASPLTVSGSSGYISVGSNDWRFRDNGGSACVIQVGSTTTTAFTASSSGTNTFLGHLAFGNTQASPHIILRGAAANTLQCGSATNFTIRPSNNSGTDAAAYNMTIAPGASTGAATPATLAFQSSAAIGSGSTLQTMVNTLTVANRRVTVTSGSSLYVVDKAAAPASTYMLTIDENGLVSSQAISGGGDALTSNPLSQFAATTSSQLAGVISDETGSGALVFANTPTLVTPVLGVATATSVNKVAITAPATSATLTIADGATLTASASATVSGANTGDQDLSGLMVKSANLSDLTNTTTARSNLGVDPAGTDNSTNVSLAGSLDYITIAGQVITRNAIDLTTDVTGVLPNGNTTATPTNTNNAIVTRDGSGNFSAGTITASLTGTASGNLPLAGGTMTGTVRHTNTNNAPSGTSQNVDWTAGNWQTLTLGSATGAVTVTFTAPASGPCNLTLKIVQGATARDITWPAAVKWDDDGEPAWSSDTSKTRIVSFAYDGTTYHGIPSATFT